MSDPEYKVNAEVQGSVSNKAMRKMKEERLCELRNALENREKAVVTKKFFVSLRLLRHIISAIQQGEKWQRLRESIQKSLTKYMSWYWRVSLTH